MDRRILRSPPVVLMKTIISTDGYHISVDDDQYERLSAMRWCTYASNSTRYAVRSSHGPTMIMHRFLTDCPADLQVDHINHDGLDNRLANLRICTKAENIRNRDARKDNLSGMRGVGKYSDQCSRLRRRGKWYARIQFEGRRINLGEFKTFELAVSARRAAELKYFGEFAYGVAA